MTRWHTPDGDRGRSIDSRRAPEDLQQKPDLTDETLSRGPADDSSPEPQKQAGGRDEARRGSHPGRNARRKHRDRTRSFSESETQALSDIGRLRILDAKDLARFVYAGDEGRMDRDMRNLRERGLVEEKTLFRAHQPHRRLLTLTRQGQRALSKTGALPQRQRIYRGFVKGREIDHDVDLYNVYQKAVQEIERQGGKPLRVRLDFELKRSINREKEAARHLPDDARANRLAAAAHDQGLTIRGTRMHLPDLQIEYETRQGEIKRENLELLSRNYREAGIRGKAQSGFTIYARAQDTSRIRRALQGTGMVREVLAI